MGSHPPIDPLAQRTQDADQVPDADPLAASDAHVRLGLGVLGRDANGNVDGMVMTALMVGAGYDVRVSPGISVVPSVSWIVGPGGYATNVLRAGVGITFH